jgi:hypothetical protein
LANWECVLWVECGQTPSKWRSSQKGGHEGVNPFRRDKALAEWLGPAELDPVTAANEGIDLVKPAQRER